MGKDNCNNIKIWTFVDYDTMDELMDICSLYCVSLYGLIRCMIFEGVEKWQPTMKRKKSPAEKNT